MFSEDEKQRIAQLESYRLFLPEFGRGQRTITVEGRLGTAQRLLGSGGSKSVFDLDLGGERFALALPNPIDSPDVIEEKWARVLNEPGNTALIRAMGIRVNTLSVTKPVKMEGLQVDGLMMHRYEDLPFEVRDSKNPLSSTGKTTLVSEGGYNESTFRDQLVPMVEEIRRLVQGGVVVGSDSFNIAIDRSKVHLFLNDLGSMRIGDIKPGDEERYKRYYFESAVSALINGLTESEYQGSKTFLKKLEADYYRSLFRSVNV